MLMLLNVKFVDRVNNNNTCNALMTRKSADFSCHLKEQNCITFLLFTEFWVWIYHHHHHHSGLVSTYK